MASATTRGWAVSVSVIRALPTKSSIPRFMVGSMQPLEALTRQAVEQAILASQGNMTAAARSLGLHRSTLYRILQRPPK